MTLHVERKGAGAPVVLLHGWGFHSSAWNGFADEWAREATLHLVDLPGHGHSREVPLGPLHETAELIAAAIPEGALLCGWSLGGLVAQRIAARRLASIRGLVLMATTPCFTQRSDWIHGVDRATLERFGADLHEDAARTLTRFVRLNTFETRQARSAIRSVERSLLDRPLASDQALDAGLEMLRAADLRGDAARIATPALVVHGARDRIAIAGAARWLAENLPDGTLLELPDSAHLPFVSDRDAVLHAIRRFDA